PARDRPDGHLAHVHLGETGKAATVPDGDHRHGAVVAARHHAPAFERIDGEVDLHPAPADARPDRERVVGILAADDDASVDRELVEALAHGRGRSGLRSLDVAPAEPAPTCERRRLGNGGERLAAAARGSRVHAVSTSRSIWSSTRSITRSTVFSTLEF